ESLDAGRDFRGDLPVGRLVVANSLAGVDRAVELDDVDLAAVPAGRQDELALSRGGVGDRVDLRPAGPKALHSEQLPVRDAVLQRALPSLCLGDDGRPALLIPPALDRSPDLSEKLHVALAQARIVSEPAQTRPRHVEL